MTGQLITLCFHGVGTARRSLEDEESHYWVEERLFLTVLDEIAGRDDVRVTFDDGNASDLEIALPALQERGLVATFFPLAGRLTSAGSLSAAGLRTLRGEGMGIGSHGMDHRPWRRLDPPARRREFVDARTMLAEASAGPVSAAALPLGQYDRGTLTSLRRLGYTAVHSSDRLRNRAGQWPQARYSLTATDTIESVRSQVLARPSVKTRVRGVAVGWIKRHR